MDTMSRVLNGVIDDDNDNDDDDDDDKVDSLPSVSMEIMENPLQELGCCADNSNNNNIVVVVVVDTTAPRSRSGPIIIFMCYVVVG
jgi:hypothetical protein